MNNSDERDYAEESANRAEMFEPDHCIRGYDSESERATSCSDTDNGGDCVHCPCCCTCRPCAEPGDVPPNAGSAS
ncbi:hypothetical protein GCM10010168_86290 [Actinoplanes ianthinogenes]|uniref:Uncharacterized protein n=1 Tax=Actinoplanes ianthinogenes TaxID=122358 RepID=A0ABN6CK36_9ACTN|nr:hypothetical protein [Actinoplanes ianthinogenes]BCJ45360.1 hypothetical protein Aiant_60170 [Actinoplanes ianthinogenes]GGR54007.1 hypothetical protein GCM10010168_86290 [Actinoplanes ianthinogenes]